MSTKTKIRTVAELSFTDLVRGLRSSVLSPFDPGFRYSAGIFYPARLIAAVTGTLVLCSGGVLLEWLSGAPVHVSQYRVSPACENT